MECKIPILLREKRIGIYAFVYIQISIYQITPDPIISIEVSWALVAKDASTGKYQAANWPGVMPR